MLRYFRIAVVVLAFAAMALAPLASADTSLAADPDLSAFHENTLTCGSTPIQILQTPPFNFPIALVKDGTSVFRFVEVTTNTQGEIYRLSAFDNPEFAATHDLVTCTFTGLISGRHFTVIGFFTPVGT